MENNSQENPVIIVTGSNKGIGYAIIESLLKTSKRCQIVLTTRTISKGQATIAELSSRFPEARNIHLVQLDLLSDVSSNKFVKTIQTKFPQGINILFNNAGVWLKSGTPASLKQMLETNFDKTVRLTELFLKNNMIKTNGRIISTASGLGKLKSLPQSNPAAISKLSAYQKGGVTLEELFGYVAACKEDLNDSTLKQNTHMGIYSLSKLYLNLWTYLRSREKDIVDKHIQVYSCCPGFCDTDLTKGFGSQKSIQDGSITPCYLINLPFVVDNNKQGKFFQDQAIVPL